MRNTRPAIAKTAKPTTTNASLVMVEPLDVCLMAGPASASPVADGVGDCGVGGGVVVSAGVGASPWSTENLIDPVTTWPTADTIR